MALLAGPKRKQKLGNDPNNTKWVNDSNEVGQTLMKKMGWKGTGLGANEDGRIAPVKASLKLDNRGLGCTPQNADAWIAHQEDFDDILASLNRSANTEGKNDKDGDTATVVDKQKTDGSRRFYGRFARGGVKQLRTTEDLNSILGRRKSANHNSTENKQQKTNEEGSDDTTSDSDDGQNEESKKKIDKVHGVVTVTSNTSVQDYFAQKMEKMQRKNIPGSSIVNGRGCDAESTEDTEFDMKEDTVCRDSYIKSDCSVQDYFAQKMKAKKEKIMSKAVDNDKLPTEISESKCNKENVSNDGEQNGNKTQGKKRKKKKNKTEHIYDDISQDAKSSSSSVKLQNLDSQKDIKKGRKKRKRDECDLDNSSVAAEEHISDVEDSKSGDSVTETKRKKKKDETVMPDCSVKKKKKKKNNAVVDSYCEEKGKDKSDEVGERNEENRSGKKRKRDKKKNAGKECDTQENEKSAMDTIDVQNKTDSNNVENKPDELSKKKLKHEMESNKANELSKKRKLAKKKLKYEMKKTFMTKIVGLRILDNGEWREEMKSIRNEIYNTVVKEKHKFFLEVASMKNSEKSDEKELEKLKSRFQQCRQAASAKVTELKNSARLKIENVEEAIIHSVKAKQKRNKSTINKFATGPHKQVEINWKDEIRELKKIRKRLIIQVKLLKKEILHDLETSCAELSKIIDESKIEIEKAKKNKSSEFSSAFPGASSVNGYLS